MTIPGITVVVDTGLARRSLFDPGSGMSRLELLRISRASATQRAGRAGRTAPGVCYRVWSEGAHTTLAAHTPAEIMETDLAPLMLDLAQWGARDAERLRWLDIPPAPMQQQARELLRAARRARRARARSPPPDARWRSCRCIRASRTCCCAPRAPGAEALAADIAALLSERDLLRAGAGARDPDLRTRLEALKRGGGRTTWTAARCSASGRRRSGCDRSWRRCADCAATRGRNAPRPRRRHARRPAARRLSRPHRPAPRRRRGPLPAQRRPRRAVPRSHRPGAQRIHRRRVTGRPGARGAHPARRAGGTRRRCCASAPRASKCATRSAGTRVPAPCGAPRALAGRAAARGVRAGRCARRSAGRRDARRRAPARPGVAAVGPRYAQPAGAHGVRARAEARRHRRLAGERRRGAARHAR